MRVVGSTLVGWLAVAGWAVAGEPVDYAREVRPILTQRCASCHGAIRQKAGLRLDTAALALEGGDGGPAVVPGRPDESPLLERVGSVDDADRMPPPSEGVPLTAEEIAVLRRWVEQGAEAPPEATPPDPRRHWAYQPPTRPEVPIAGRNPVDAFLEAARRDRGLTAAPPISKDLWLRRVTLDLVGLPPTADELASFRADTSAEAHERVVDRLLASPSHGERWARHWMDVWRYSDWYGLGQELRFSHYHIWRWRDWIVESLNADAGYDDMVVAMLAGDEQAPDDPATLRATGFLARNWDIFNRNKWLDSTIEHTSRAFLGVTMQCARCHDHKFDPVSQVDYYRLRAFFEPYQIRIDRVPGQPDRTKDGLVRAFDDYLVTPTHLFRRGDETQPDTSRPLTPATPAVLGGALAIEPVALPVSASRPDKRAFVIEETRQAAAQAVDQARAAVEAARNAQGDAAKAEQAGAQAEDQARAALRAASKPEDQAGARERALAAVEQAARARRAVAEAPGVIRTAELALAVAEARRDALAAVLEVERLEDAGAKTSEPDAWSEAAHAAVAAQRRLAVAEAVAAEFAAERSAAAARVALDGLLAAAPDPKDETLKAARAKAVAGLLDEGVKLAAATDQRIAAERTAGEPPTTDYTPRPLEFPRAKVTYRDTPSNAPYATTSTGRRLALARWIVDRRNPLAARVAVNHVWARHFGEPLVPSVFDFGLRSPRPVHQDLLDWLAVELMASGWSLKALHRIIVTSDAYRMRSAAAVADDPNRAVDPDNRFYWRMNPRRMEAEVIRDSLLHLAGRLDPTRGGPDLPVASAEDGTRRTLYYRYARGDRMLFLTMFDAPNVEECYRRHETIVPQQALALINSKLALDRAEEIARRIGRELGTADDATFAASAFERVLGRAPTDAERDESVRGLEALTAAGPAGADARERARVAFVHVLLNHNDFVTIR